VAVPPPSALPREPAASREPALATGQLCKETVESRSSSSLVFKVKPPELTPDSTTQTRLHVLSLPAGAAWAGAKGKLLAWSRWGTEGAEAPQTAREGTRREHSKAAPRYGAPPSAQLPGRAESAPGACLETARSHHYLSREEWAM